MLKWYRVYDTDVLTEDGKVVYVDCDGWTSHPYDKKTGKDLTGQLTINQYRGRIARCSIYLDF